MWAAAARRGLRVGGVIRPISVPFCTASVPGASGVPIVQVQVDSNQGFWTLGGAIIGVAGSVLGAWYATHSAIQEKQQQEQNKQDLIRAAHLAKVADMVEKTKRAQDLVWTSRQELLDRRNAQVPIRLLHSAKDLVAHLLGQYDALAPEYRAEFDKEFPASSACSVLHFMNGHIDYHLASLHLKDLHDGKQATQLLASSLASYVVSRAPQEELLRHAIKQADSLSHTHDAVKARELYQYVQRRDMLNTFWHLRAQNNLAVLQFGQCRDQEAVQAWVQVSNQCSDWFSRRLTTSPNSVDQLSEDCTKVLKDLQTALDKKDSKEQQLQVDLDLLDKFQQLVLATADCVVDIAQHWSPMQKADFRLPQNGNLSGKEFRIAVEYLERTKLLARKRLTSNVNVLLAVTSPWAQYRVDQLSTTSDADAAFIADRLIGLLQVPESAILVNMDHKWLAGTGRVRVLTATAMALTELVRINAVQASEVLPLVAKLLEAAKAAYESAEAHKDIYTALILSAEAYLNTVQKKKPYKLLDSTLQTLRRDAGLTRKAAADAGTMGPSADHELIGRPFRCLRWQAIIARMGRQTDLESSFTLNNRPYPLFAFKQRPACKQPLPDDQVQALKQLVEAKLEAWSK